MSEHVLHSVFIFLPVLLSLFLLRKNILSAKGAPFFVAITIVLFITFHTSPAILLFVSHHQSAHKTEHHPCCIPQIADCTHEITISFVSSFYRKHTYVVQGIVIVTPISLYSPRSPPFI